MDGTTICLILRRADSKIGEPEARTMVFQRSANLRSSGSCAKRRRFRPLLGNARQETRLLDDVALVEALADHLYVVTAHDLEDELAALDLDQLDAGRDVEADRGGGAVAHVHVRADGALTRRKVRAQRLDTSPFDEADQDAVAKTGGISAKPVNAEETAGTVRRSSIAMVCS